MYSHLLTATFVTNQLTTKPSIQSIFGEILAAATDSERKQRNADYEQILFRSVRPARRERKFEFALIANKRKMRASFVDINSSLFQESPV